jgi:hypothetical protein
VRLDRGSHDPVTAQSGSQVTVTNVDWNGGLPTGGSVSFGFGGTPWTGIVTTTAVGTTARPRTMFARTSPPRVVVPRAEIEAAQPFTRRRAAGGSGDGVRP